MRSSMFYVNLMNTVIVMYSLSCTLGCKLKHNNCMYHIRTFTTNKNTHTAIEFFGDISVSVFLVNTGTIERNIQY